MPAVLVTGPTVMQNSPFSSLAVAIAIARTHCAYPRRDGQAELTWVAGYVLRSFWLYTEFGCILSAVAFIRVQCCKLQDSHTVIIIYKSFSSNFTYVQFTKVTNKRFPIMLCAAVLQCVSAVFTMASY